MNIEEQKNGCVVLVGAGPGDPGLMTVAGKAALEHADVVLYDRLVAPGVMSMVAPSAVLVDVGKNKGNHPTPQDAINALIVEYAQRGKRVVRLKGGDPYLFGRGAEELEQLRVLGIPFRVVPGISSSLAAPAYAGIPVTHRDYASSVHILTGHGKGGSAPAIPYEQLAGMKGTLVFLMSLTAIHEICGSLVAAGMPPETPAAVIENGARNNQRKLVATLSDLPGKAGAESFSSPALMVVGAVCALADKYDWLGRLPLFGKRILVASSQATASRLAVTLRELGAETDDFAGIALSPLPTPDSLWQRLDRFSWIVFTSKFGIDLFFSSLRRRRIDVRRLGGARFAAVGQGSADALAGHGIYADVVPAEHHGAALAAEVVARAAPGESVLLFRAEAGSPELARALEGRGLDLVEIPAYRTEKNAPPAEVAAAVRAGSYAAATFTSGSAVEALADGLSAAGADASSLLALCIGEATAAAARSRGMRARAAPEATLDSLAALVIERLGKP